MQHHHLERIQFIDRPLGEVFDFFADAGNLEAITPDFLRFRILTPLPIEMREGARIEYSLSLFSVPVRWKTVIREWQPGVRFVDEQESGPFALWRHTHEFREVPGGVEMRDHVAYREPLGPLGSVAHGMFVERLVERIFDHRAEVIPVLLGATPSPARSVRSTAP